MRTTITLAKDVVAAVEDLRRSEGIGVSAAINRLVRNGLAKPAIASHYEHISYEMGERIDVSNISNIQCVLDETAW